MALRVSLDTNCLLRWILQDITAQARIVDKILKDSRTVHVADVAIVEMVYVLQVQYNMPRDLIADYIEIVVTHPNINCSAVLFKAVLLIYTSYPALSFSDCCLAIYADKNDAKPLLTFDQKLARQLPNLAHLAK